MSSASCTDGNERAVPYAGEVHQRFQGSPEAAVHFWVATKEKGEKTQRRWIILYWKYSSYLEFLVSPC